MIGPKAALLALFIGALIVNLNALPSKARLVEIDDSGALPFGQVNSDSNKNDNNNYDVYDDDDDEGGIKIDGPLQPDKPGSKLEDKSEGEDKIIEDPWRPFYDPDHKTPFGQKFPIPEDVTQVPKRPGVHFPDPEKESPNKNNGHNESNDGFENKPCKPMEGLGFGPGGYPDGCQEEEPKAQEPQYPQQPNYTEEPHHTEEPHYPDEPYYPEQPQYPEEPYYPEEPNYPKEPYYPPESSQPNQPDYSDFNEPEPPATQKPSHGSIFGDIIGGIADTIHGKHESHHGYEESGHSSGGGLGILGGIFGQSNTDSVNKAVESVKEAKEKVVDAGKNIFDAGKQISGSILGKHKHHGFFSKFIQPK